MADKQQTPTPPKSCPICKVAMQTGKEDGRLVHACQNCGMTIIHPLPDDEE